MQLPPSLLDSLNHVKGFDREAFEKIHASGEQITSIRINPAKWDEPGKSLLTGIDKQPESLLKRQRIPWTSYGYYLPQRPSFTFDPFFHAGCYYVQEASSMFLEQVLRENLDLSRSLRVLDCCAAPGGKSTHLQSLISADSILVSNEVIRSRVNILRDNIIKWGSGNVVVTNNDPKRFARMENYFDLIVVDAPCSGSGLFRRDEDAVGEWSENNVTLCARRQQRILADLMPGLKKGGMLVYSTCSYSQPEDEEILRWLEKDWSMQVLPVTMDPSWGIVESGGGYRFWPYRLKGEGFFIACLQKSDGDARKDFGKQAKKVNKATREEKEIASIFFKTNEAELIRHNDQLYAWPAPLVNDFNYLVQHMHVIYAGVHTGEIIRDKMIPAHALALSSRLRDDIPALELDFQQAIRYLQRKDTGLVPEKKGWQPVSYKGCRLGWINALPGRVNNYYPQELRILKES